MPKLSVIGAGTMGRGIAQVAATAGWEVILGDQDANVLMKASDNLRKILNRLVEKGKIKSADAIFNRIQFSEEPQDYRGSHLVIEAIVENLEVKKKLLEQVEGLVDDACILATNTSSLSIASVGAALKKPERIVGIHFFNPAPLMPLVEIIPAVQTDTQALLQAREWIDNWGKTTVLAKDTPGFIVNRVARPFYGESLRMYEEGVADFATIDHALKTMGGFRMGPFELMDFIGNDVNYTVTETVFNAFYYDPRYRPSFTQKRMAEAGFLGRKSGKGYYLYADDAEPPEPNVNEALGKQILHRVLTMLINEAADALFLRIASRDDIDLAMTRGVNYPKGLLAWADEIGIAKVVNRMDALYQEYHEDRYRCSPLLRRMLNKGDNFYS